MDEGGGKGPDPAPKTPCSLVSSVSKWKVRGKRSPLPGKEGVQGLWREVSITASGIQTATLFHQLPKISVLILRTENCREPTF